MVDRIRLVERALGTSILTQDIVIDEGLCVAARHRRCICSKCIDACPHGALVLEGRSVVCDELACTHCGACISACPTEAISSTLLSKKDILARLANSIEATERRPVLACSEALGALSAERRFANDRVVALPCLDRIDEALLLSALAMHAGEVSLVCGNCAECGTGCGAFERTLASVKGILQQAGLGEGVRFEVVREFPAHAFGVERAEAGESGEPSTERSTLSRRELLSGTKGRIAKAASDVADEVIVGSALHSIASQLGLLEPDSPIVASSRGQVSAWAIGALVEPLLSGEQLDDERAMHIASCRVDSRLFGLPQIDFGKCHSCHLCTTYCPTGALVKKSEGPKVLGFEIRQHLCCQCLACANICKIGALELKTSVRLSDVLLEKVRYQLYD